MPSLSTMLVRASAWMLPAVAMPEQAATQPTSPNDTGQTKRNNGGELVTRARRTIFRNLLSCVLLLAAPALHARCYVTPSGVPANLTFALAGVSSWALPIDLYTALGSAMIAPACKEIWVARGVYRPISTSSPGDRTTAFVIAPDVQLYGGFNGTETQLSQRNADPATNGTVLSGDIDYNDTNVSADGVIATSDDIVGSNSYHVVLVDGILGAGVTASTVLDGFTITGGDATDDGGALFCMGEAKECSPTLRNLIFSGNRAGHDIHNMFGIGTGSELTDAGYGGAIYNDGSNGGKSNPTLSNVVFNGNSAGDLTSSGSGGAMFDEANNGGESSPTLDHVTFRNNRAGWAGAVENRGASTLTLTDVAFIGNSAGNTGGALVANGNAGASVAKLVRVVFDNNQCGDGSAIYSQGSDVSLTNVTISGGNGSALSTTNSTTTLTNVTISGAKLAISVEHEFIAGGGGVDLGSVVTMTNSVLWNNSDNGGTSYGATWNITRSIVQGGCPTETPFGTNNCTDLIAGDPLLGPLQNNGGFTATMRPKPGSAAIDAGDDAACPGTDQRGVARPQGAHCDLGAVEVGQYAVTLSVASAGSASSTTPAIPATTNGIANCSSAGGTCSAVYVEGAQVALAAAPGWHFATASGCGGAALAGDERTDTTAALAATCTIGATFAANQTKTSLISSVAPSTYGQSVTFTATASGVVPANTTPTGTVTFKDGSTPLGTGSLDASGAATFVASALSAGTHSITAQFGGDSNYLAASQPVSNTLVQGVNRASQSIPFGAAPTIVVNGTGTVTATTTATPSASYPITFSTASTACTVTSTGVVAGKNAGTNNCVITATQAGDTNYNGATATQTLSIGKASQSITFGATPAVAVNGTGAVTATTTATPSASYPITFSTASTSCTVTSTGVVAGKNAGANNCTITATQAGDGNYNSATATQTLSIGAASQSITFGVAPTVFVNGTGTVTATTSATPSASYPITFSTASTACTVTSTGVVAGKNAGTNNCVISATQSGDANYNGATATQTLSIGKVSASLSLTSSANPSPQGSWVMFAATVSSVAPASADPSPMRTSSMPGSQVGATQSSVAATPTGTITFSDGASALGTVALVNGSATFDMPFATAGSHTITAAYSGDAATAAANITLVQAVSAADPVAPAPALSTWLLGLLGGLLVAVGLARVRGRG